MPLVVADALVAVGTAVTALAPGDRILVSRLIRADTVSPCRADSRCSVLVDTRNPPATRSSVRAGSVRFSSIKVWICRSWARSGWATLAPWARARAEQRHSAVHSGMYPRAPRALPARPPPRILRPAQTIRANSAASNSANARTPPPPQTPNGATTSSRVSGATDPH